MKVPGIALHKSDARSTLIILVVKPAPRLELHIHRFRLIAHAPGLFDEVTMAATVRELADGWPIAMNNEVASTSGFNR